MNYATKKNLGGVVHFSSVPGLRVCKIAPYWDAPVFVSNMLINARSSIGLTCEPTELNLFCAFSSGVP